MATAAPVKKSRTIYKLADGTTVPGVTTVLNVLNKPFLVTWANNLGLQGINSREYVDELAQVGTLTHLMVECDIKGVEPDTHAFTQLQIEQARPCFVKWLAWRAGKEIVPILQESPLVSEEFRFGGTVDIHAAVDGVCTLIDIKTAKAVYSEQVAQVIAYQRLLEEHHFAVQRACIVRIGRNEAEAFEVREITDTNRSYWNLFLAALDIYRIQKEVKW